MGMWRRKIERGRRGVGWGGRWEKLNTDSLSICLYLKFLIYLQYRGWRKVSPWLQWCTMRKLFIRQFVFVLDVTLLTSNYWPEILSEWIIGTQILLRWGITEWGIEGIGQGRQASVDMWRRKIERGRRGGGWGVGGWTEQWKGHKKEKREIPVWMIWYVTVRIIGSVSGRRRGWGAIHFSYGCYI